MNPRILLLALPLSLHACSRPEVAPSGGGGPAAVPADPAAAGALLPAYRWRLEAATDAQGGRIAALFPGPENVLTLRFEEGRAAVSGGCNQMSGSYELDAELKLRIGPLRSTLMACEAPLMEADAAVAKLLAQPQHALLEPGAPPRLQLLSAGGEATRWRGEPTPETRFGGPGERVFLEVAPQRIPCDHPLMPDHQCLEVREVTFDEHGVRRSPPGPWHALHEEIEGFEFRAGERTVLRLKRFRRDPPPADGSSIVYVLDMVVESEVAPGGQDG